MYPNKGRLLRESAVRDGGVVRGGYSNASEGSLWGPEKELLGRSGCLGRVCWQHSTRHHPSLSEPSGKQELPAPQTRSQALLAPKSGKEAAKMHSGNEISNNQLSSSRFY